VPVLVIVRNDYSTFTLLKSLVICLGDATTMAMIFLPKMLLVLKYDDFDKTAVASYVARTLTNSTEHDSVFEELRIKGRKPEEETDMEENNGRGGGGCCWHHRHHQNKNNNNVTVARWWSSFFSGSSPRRSSTMKSNAQSSAQSKTHTSKVVRAAPDTAVSMASWASSGSSGVEDSGLSMLRQKTPEEVAGNNLDVLVVQEELRKARAEIAAQEKLALQQAHEMRNK
jgi:hypothetical protein